MTLTSVFVDAQTIVDRVRLHMPVNILLRDPISNAEFQVYRENILKSLVVDTPNIVIDAQQLAANYAEMARAQRACERAAALGERAFVAWKAKTAAEARAAAKAEGKAKITGAEAEEAYRTHPDYAEKAGVKEYYETLAGLFEDLKRAFDLKARMIEAQMRYFGGDMRMRRAEDTADMDRAVEQSIERSRNRGRSPSE